MNAKRSTPWLLCCLSAILLSVISLSPLVLSAGQITPKLGGVPYCLWMGILLTIGLVALTFVGSKVHPGHKEGGA